MASPQPSDGAGAHADNEGVRIYYETHGDGPPLLLHHGFAGSSVGWKDFGYVDALKGQFRVIVMDARGHGRSDKPHDPAAYTREARTADVAAVLDACGVTRAHYWGYSMGGRTGFAFADLYPERIASFVDGAAAPGAEAERERMQRWADALKSGDPAAIARDLQVPEQYVRQLVGDNDLEALAAAQLGLMDWDFVDPSTLDLPSFHYAGENDPIMPSTRAAAAAMPGARFELLPGLNHLSGFTRSDLTLPVVRPFLDSVAASAA